MARIKLICADSLKVLPKLPDASVDAVVTDPPFGIGKEYAGKREAASDPDTYWRWFRPFYEEMLRVLKPGGLMAIWQSTLYMPHFWKWYGQDIHVFIVAKTFVQLRPTPINYAYDPVVMFYKPGARPLAPTKGDQSDWRTLDYFVARTGGPRPRLLKGHPAPPSA